MHFEVDESADAVRRVADRIRAGKMPDQVPAWKPRKAFAVHFGRVQEQFLIAAGAQKGEIVQNNGVGLFQEALNKVLGTDLVVDGICGEATLNAWGRFERDVVGEIVGRPRVPDRKSADELVERAGLDLVGDPWNNES